MDGTDWAGRKVAAERGKDEGLGTGVWMEERVEVRRERVGLGKEGQEE